MLQYTGYRTDMLRISENLSKIKDPKIDTEFSRLLAIEAGRIACNALNKLLYENSFWSWLRKCELQQLDPTDVSGIQDLDISFSSELFDFLDYNKPRDGKRIIAEAIEAIEKVKSGLYKDSKLAVRTKIEMLAVDTCGLVQMIVHSEPNNDVENGFYPMGKSYKKSSSSWVDRILTNFASTCAILAFLGVTIDNISGKSSSEAEKPSIVEHVSEPEKLAFSYFLTGLQPYKEPNSNEAISESQIEAERKKRFEKWQAEHPKGPKFILDPDKDNKKNEGE